MLNVHFASLVFLISKNVLDIYVERVVRLSKFVKLSKQVWPPKFQLAGGEHGPFWTLPRSAPDFKYCIT